MTRLLGKGLFGLAGALFAAIVAGDDLNVTLQSHIVYLPDQGFCDQTITRQMVTK